MHDDDIALSSLIGGIYDAALESERWPQVLGGVSRFVGGQASALVAKDAASKSGAAFYHDDGIEPSWVALYFDKYVKYDPMTTRHFFTEIGGLVSTTDALPYDEFLETRFYREWAKPQQLVDNVSAILDKSLTSVSLFNVFRHARHGLVDDDMRHRLTLLVPHVRRASLIGNIVEHQSMHASALADTLDTIGAGMFLVDAAGRIVHANVAGHRLLADGGLLRGPGGRLTAVDTVARRALDESFSAAAAGDDAIGSHGLALPLTSLVGERYAAHVLPLTAGARRIAGASYAAVAALFVHRAAPNQQPVPQLLLRAFGLTPSELRVLLAVVEMGGTAEVAEALGIAESTVRFHLQALFAKTGARRQAELVKLVAAYTSPLSP